MKKLLLLNILLILTNSAFCNEMANPGESVWTDELREVAQIGCVTPILEGQKDAYYAKAKSVGNDNPKPFPTDMVVKALLPLCECAVTKLEEAGFPPDALSIANPEAIETFQNALFGGECKMGGKIGAAMESKK